MRDKQTLDLFGWKPESPEPEGDRQRHRAVAGRQRALVFEVLRAAYPHPVSHATICEKVGTNRASHRIRELIQAGWQIEGAGALGLDAGSQTQLYRLASLERGEPSIKYLGLKVLWDQDGLRVSLHRDIDELIDRRRLQALARRIERLVREELGGVIAGEE